ncbi:MAG: hypothetical protein JKY27_01005 [Magnetovibrio sp.]|nr:hypothetical protein [Magnetovibrio sp.]
MKKKDDAYIGLIKFIKTETEQTGLIDFSKAKKFMTTQYQGFNEHAAEEMLRQITLRASQTGGGSMYVLSSQAYFHLLEYEELEQARSSSKTALWFATAALAVSITVGAVSITLQLLQNSTPPNVIIDASQVEQIKGLVRDKVGIDHEE